MLHPATATASTCYPLPHRPPYGSRHPLLPPYPRGQGRNQRTPWILNTHMNKPPENTQSHCTITLLNGLSKSPVVRGTSPGRVDPWVKALRRF